MPIDRQAEESRPRKALRSGMIVDPVTISPDITLRQALEIMRSTASPACPSPAARASPASLPIAICASKKSQSTRQLGHDERQSRHRSRRHTLDEAERILQKHRMKNFSWSIRTSTSKA